MLTDGLAWYLQYNDNMLKVFEKNIRAYIEEQPMANLVTLPVPPQ
jgi:hypothetical protein